MDIESQTMPVSQSASQPISPKKILATQVIPRKLTYVLDRLSFHRLNRVGENHLRARGHKMAVFANEHIGGFIHVFGVYEQEELDVLFRFLQPLHSLFRSGLCLDIGANIGNHSLYFSKLFDEVQCFEPDPSTFLLLQFNASFRHKVKAFNLGLGDQRGTFTLAEVPNNMGESVIVTDKSKVGPDVICIDVQVERLDNLDFSERGPCFIKMDVEGFEPKVLLGGLRTISTHWPLIVLEQHEGDFVDGQSESVNILRDLGYKFCWHQSGVLSKNTLVRRIFNFKEMFAGRTHRVVTADSVPPGHYSMLIAVPPRFQNLLQV